MAIFLYLHFPSAWKKDSGAVEKLALSRSDAKKKKRLEEKMEQYGQHVLASFGVNDFDV